MPTGIYKRQPMSEEHKQAISNAHKRSGFMPSLKCLELSRLASIGRKHSQEAIEKNRISHLGKKASEETKKKMSLTRKGRKLTKEWCAAISLGNKGRPAPAGCLTKDYRERMSLIKMGHPTSQETRIKLSKENCHLWKGGITPISRALRNGWEYRAWRNSILERDNYICQECSIRGGSLHVDHIKPFSFILKKYQIKTFEQALGCQELWETQNGRTLCVPCHKKTNTWQTKANLYEE